MKIRGMASSPSVGSSRVTVMDGLFVPFVSKAVAGVGGRLTYMVSRWDGSGIS